MPAKTEISRGFWIALGALAAITVVGVVQGVVMKAGHGR